VVIRLDIGLGVLSPAGECIHDVAKGGVGAGQHFYREGGAQPVIQGPLTLKGTKKRALIHEASLAQHQTVKSEPKLQHATVRCLERYSLESYTHACKIHIQSLLA
jgi:hypothetical protein